MLDSKLVKSASELDIGQEQRFEQLNLKGGVVRIGGKVVAFTIGEGINSNTFCIHIEKAGDNKLPEDNLHLGYFKLSSFD